MRSWIAAATIGACLAGCSGGEATRDAEAEAQHIHRQLDAGQFHEIWAASTPDLKQVSPSERFEPLLAAVHRKLGRVQDAKPSGWRVNYGPGGSTVELVYQTRFEHGPATEDFIFRTGKGHAQLLGYHINSDALITG